MNVLRYVRKDPIRIALAVSLLLHAAALVKIPALRPAPKPEVTRGGPLIVQLAPRPSPSPSPRVQRPARAAPLPAPPEPPRTVERPPPPPRPPVIARSDPAPVAVAPPRPSPPASVPAAPVPPSSGDFAAFVEARRRERGESAPAPPAPLATAPSAPAPLTAEDENARATRLAAANLGLDRKPTYGPDRRGGGIFDPVYISSDYAEFVFYGWNKDIRRNTQQKIEVRRGQNPDIRIAMVRRMIVIIREHEKEEFVWESRRLNRDVTLSARLQDNAGLEDFLMREFFDDVRRPTTR